MKIKVYKNRYVEDLISYEDYLQATGLDDDTAYPRLLEGPFERQEDGDFVVRIDLETHEEAVILRQYLPEEVIARNRFGVEYCQ